MVKIPRWFLLRLRGLMSGISEKGELYGSSGSPSAVPRMSLHRCRYAGMKWPHKPRSSGFSRMILISCVISDASSNVLFNSSLLEETVKCCQISDAQHTALLGYEAHLLEPRELAGHSLSVRADPACDFFMGGRRRYAGFIASLAIAGDPQQFRMHPVADGQRAELEHALREQSYDRREMNHDGHHEHRLFSYRLEEGLAWNGDGRACGDRLDAGRARMPVDSRKFAENSTLPYLAKTHALAR